MEMPEGWKRMAEWTDDADGEDVQWLLDLVLEMAEALDEEIEKYPQSQDGTRSATKAVHVMMKFKDWK